MAGGLKPPGFVLIEHAAGYLDDGPKMYRAAPPDSHDPAARGFFLYEGVG
jgi:hypothetical protein